MKIAHVGADKKYSAGDQYRIVSSYATLFECGIDFTRQKIRRDIVNLNCGRDFLQEKKEYDMVVLHSIFHTDADVKNISEDSRIYCGLSIEHSLEAWRKRLIETKASHIVICENQPFSLNGWNIGELGGYKIINRDEEITIYEKTAFETNLRQNDRDNPPLTTLKQKVDTLV